MRIFFLRIKHFKRTPSKFLDIAPKTLGAIESHFSRRPCRCSRQSRSRDLFADYGRSFSTTGHVAQTSIRPIASRQSVGQNSYDIPMTSVVASMTSRYRVCKRTEMSSLSILPLSLSISSKIEQANLSEQQFWSEE